MQANQYQERLNQIVFGYPSVKRLGQQIRLQRTLRRPQLSDSLDERLLNELLSDALPEIDSELLDASSKRLDQIEESRVRLETLKRNEAPYASSPSPTRATRAPSCGSARPAPRSGGRDREGGGRPRRARASPGRADEAERTS